MIELFNYITKLHTSPFVWLNKTICLFKEVSKVTLPVKYYHTKLLMYSNNDVSLNLYMLIRSIQV